MSNEIRTLNFMLGFLKLVLKPLKLRKKGQLWEGLLQEILKELVDTMLLRVETVLKANGSSTRW